MADIEAKMKAARDKAYMEGKGGQDTEEILQLELQRQKLLGDVLTLEQQISAEKDRQQEARRIAEETGLSQQESLRIDHTKSALEERAANRQDGGRQRIQGYSAMSQGTADEARSRAEQRMADARSRVQDSYDRFMPGLKGGAQDNPLAQNATADKPLWLTSITTEYMPRAVVG